MYRYGHGHTSARRGELGGRTRGRCGAEDGQASPEWIGLLLLLAALLAMLIALGPLRIPGGSLARAIGEKLLCAVNIARSCDPSVDQAYAAEVAALVHRHAPSIEYEHGTAALPVDFRRCFADAPCSLGALNGAVTETRDGEPVTTFVRVVDCRPGAPSQPGVRCGWNAVGNLYIQYWLYYPESATWRKVPGLRDAGYHPHDWESYQVKIGPDGSISARSSSHKGYNNGGILDRIPSVGSDTGVVKRPAWGPTSGWTFVSGGSHAGHVPRGPRSPERMTPASALQLIPLETLTDADRDRPWTKHRPPWLKQVYNNPESASTG